MKPDWKNAPEWAQYLATYAWGHYFGNGYQGTNIKAGKNSVRAIRKLLIE